MSSNGGWNPYLAGALVGILAVMSVVVTTQILGKGSYLGASTTFVRGAGLIEKQIMPENVTQNDYFVRTKIKVDWQMMFVIGIFCGALLASLSDGSFRKEKIPPMWRERFPYGVWCRAVAAFGGGVIAIFGARLAGGCPSGHGLSGVMQLSLSGLVAMAGFMVGGIVIARAIYGGREYPWT
ncbi:MAG: YeeE/YedE family protein [Desulfuromonadaceae bacterium]|nr:YeeE/YedE family protein [Desulfuromonadaceae bacterium]